MKKKQYSIQELIIIKNPLLTNREVADKIGATYYTVFYERKRLGVKSSRSFVPFSTDEEDFIMKNKNAPTKIIANHLKRSIESVSIKRKKLGAKREPSLSFSATERKYLIDNIDVLSDKEIAHKLLRTKREVHGEISRLGISRAQNLKKLKLFFAQRGINLYGVCADADVSVQNIELVLRDSKPLAPEIAEKLLPVLKKYGWKYNSDEI